MLPFLIHGSRSTDGLTCPQHKCETDTLYNYPQMLESTSIIFSLVKSLEDTPPQEPKGIKHPVSPQGYTFIGKGCLVSLVFSQIYTKCI